MLQIEGYWKPESIAEALERLSAGDVKILAGGTDLVLELGRKHEAAKIIDLGGLAELKTIREDEDQVGIGSGVTFSQLQHSPVIIRHCLALAQAAGLVGSPQIRNQGTVGGNIANASPAADTVPALVMMDAEVIVAKKGGQRRLKVTDLLRGINKTDLAADELILEIIFRKLPGFQSSFSKLGRRNALAISRMSAAAGFSVDDQQMIRQVRVALGSVAPNPFRSAAIEDELTGKDFDLGLDEHILETASRDVAARLGARATAPYKREAIKGVVRHALAQVFAASRMGG